MFNFPVCFVLYFFYHSQEKGKAEGERKVRKKSWMWVTRKLTGQDIFRQKMKTTVIGIYDKKYCIA